MSNTISALFSSLLDCFTEVLHELGEGELAAMLPWSGNGAVAASGKLLQAYSLSFHLLNIASGVHRNLNAIPLNRLRALFDERPADRKKLLTLIASVKVEPVFTAHPTEAKRVTVLEHHRELFMLAEAAASSGNSLKGAGRERAKLIIERLWRTGEIYVDKPDVQSEVRNVFYYLEEIFPEALALADK